MCSKSFVSENEVKRCERPQFLPERGCHSSRVLLSGGDSKEVAAPFFLATEQQLSQLAATKTWYTNRNDEIVKDPSFTNL